MISMMDAQLGALTAKLKELGLEDNTIVIFSSDNGPSTDRGGVDGEFFNSSGGLRGRKGSLYEGGIREPMIVRWPGKVAPGSQTDFPSAQYDILPTLSEIAGVSPPEPYDGVSLLPTLLGRPADQKPHDYLYWEFPGSGGSQAVQRGDWKIVRTKVNGNPATPWELYNIKSDERETTDLAGKHPDIVSEMAPLARQAHWQPIISEWEFIDPKKPIDPDRLSGAGGE
jgi:arylsulfatase A-like enzyme